MNTSKIIRAVVGGGRYTTTAPIMKEDYGIVLKIENLELPASYEVDFSNSCKGGDSVTVIGDEDGVLIPTQFIRDGEDVFAFLYWVGPDYGRTVYTFCIPNRVRPDRTNEQPEPEQQSVIDQAISALNTAVAQTAQDVIDADASATSAANSASSAAQSAAEAAESAQGTKDYATRAEAAQTAAETAQTAAQTAAATATTKAAQASAAESAAASAAQTATAKAIEADVSATSAAQSASSAAQSASSAATSATTASTKASEASASASTASTKATEATTAAGTATTAKTAAETAKNAAQTAQAAAEDAAESVSESAAQIATNTADITVLKENLNQKAPVILETTSGSIASFSDGADDMPIKSLVVDIDPVQSGSGDPSPDNVRPISGWTGAVVARTGINIWDEEWEDGYINPLNGLEAADPNKIRMKNYVPVLPNTTYYKKTPIAYWNVYFDKNKQHISYSNPSEGEFTTPADCYYIRSGFEVTYGTTYNHDISINYPSTDHDYHEGHPQSVTIDWQSEAGTVYGGTLDIVSGVLTINQIYFTDTWGNGDSSTAIDSYERRIFSGLLGSAYPNYSKTPISNIAPYSASWAGAFTHFYVNADGTRNVIVILPQGTDDNTVIQVVYELAEPLTVQLSATEVKSLLGQNHVWADTGNVDVEYRADTKLYIQRLTQPDTADMIADANITSGQYFMVGNDLYKATANIANGGQIIVGTNCIRKSLSEALNEINA